MSAPSPWSVKGIDPRARDAARAVARREGLTLGEYLNRLILEPIESDDRAASNAEPALGAAAPRRWREPGFGDLFAPADPGRLGHALERLTHRIEAAERRSSLAIGDIEQSVASILARMEGGDRAGQREAARVEERMRELRAAQEQIADRIKRMERAGQSSDSAGLKALEAALARLADQSARREEASEEQRAANAAAAERQEALARALEARLSAADQRIEAVDSRVAAAADGLQNGVERIAERLNRAEMVTNQAIVALERSFTHLDHRLSRAERAGLSPELSAMIAKKVDGLAGELGAMVESVRTELAGELETALTGLKSGAIETAIDSVAGRLSKLERVQDAALKAASEEMRKVAQSLETRIAALESRPAAGGDLGAQIARLGEGLDQKLAAAEDRNAAAIEKVGEYAAQAAERLQTRQDAAISTLSEKLRDNDARTEARLAAALAAMQSRIDQSDSRLESGLSPVQKAVAALARRLESLEDLTTGTPNAAADFGASAHDIPREPPFDPAENPEFSALDASEPDVSELDFPERDFPERDFPEPDFPQADFPESDFVAIDDHAPAVTADELAAFSDRVSGEELIDFNALPLPHLGADHTLDIHDAGPRADERDPLLEAFGRAGFGPNAHPAPATADVDDALHAHSPEPRAEPPSEPARSSLGESLLGVSLHDFDPPDDATLTFPIDGVEAPAPAQAAPAPAESTPPAREDFLTMARRAAREQAERERKGVKLQRPTATLAGEQGPGALGQGRRALHITALAVTLAAVGGFAWQQWRGRHAAQDGPKLAPSKDARKPAAPRPSPAAPARPSPPAAAAPVPDTAGAIEAPSAPALPAPAPAVNAPKPAAFEPKGIIGQRPGTIEQAAAAGDPIAQYELGVSEFDAGRHEEASRLIQRAADQGLPAAQYRLAKMYEKGDSVPADLHKARVLTEAAAVAGNRKAMHDIAVYYAEDEGGGQDFAAAARWFRRAAERGLSDSQYNLGVFYDQGLGVKADPEEALFWFALAERAGDRDAKARVEELSHALDAARVQKVRSRLAAFQPRLIDPAAQGDFGARSWRKDQPPAAAKK